MPAADVHGQFLKRNSQVYVDDMIYKCRLIIEMHLHWCWVVHLVFGVRPSSVAIVVEGKNMLKSQCLLAILQHAFLIEPLSPNKKNMFERKSPCLLGPISVCSTKSTHTVCDMSGKSPQPRYG